VRCKLELIERAPAVQVTALAPGGSLRGALDAGALGWADRVAAAAGVAAGVAYLHEVRARGRPCGTRPRRAGCCGAAGGGACAGVARACRLTAAALTRSCFRAAGAVRPGTVARHSAQEPADPSPAAAPIQAPDRPGPHVGLGACCEPAERDPTACWQQGAHAPLVHRDLTSSNILLGADGRACIAVRPRIGVMLICLTYHLADLAICM